MTQLQIPEGRDFIFTVFDDTDNATLLNTRPVYDLLSNLGIRTTKSVWVEPSRGQDLGTSLSDEEYRSWICQLQADGFEIGFHGVGDGEFARDEILQGIESFREILGHYPEVYTNHLSNSHNMYWGRYRFPWPFSWLYSLLEGVKGKGHAHRGGHIKGSDVYWGDALKEHVRFIRNLTFGDINTIGCDPKMPYRRRATPLANYWFSSSDGHTVEEFNDLIAPENIDRLEREGGVCIAYTHFGFGFVDESGAVNPTFRSRMEYLAERNGWFVPTGTVLEHLLAHQGENAASVSTWYQQRLTVRWLIDRIRKRLRYGR